MLTVAYTVCLNSDDSLVIKWGKANSVLCAQRAKEWGVAVPADICVLADSIRRHIPEDRGMFAVILSFVPV
jgi:hypothetical protein